MTNANEFRALTLGRVQPIMEQREITDFQFFRFIINRFQFRLCLAFLMNCRVTTCNGLRAEKLTQQ